jgi:GTPase
MRQDMRLRRESLIAVTCDSEDALEASLQRLAAAAGADGAASTVLRRRGGGGADVLVRRQHDAAVELRVAVIGNVDAGASRAGIEYGRVATVAC